MSSWCIGLKAGPAGLPERVPPRRHGLTASRFGRYQPVVYVRHYVRVLLNRRMPFVSSVIGARSGLSAGLYCGDRPPAAITAMEKTWRVLHVHVGQPAGQAPRPCRESFFADKQ
jgi:hypothetical protein